MSAVGVVATTSPKSGATAGDATILRAADAADAPAIHALIDKYQSDGRLLPRDAREVATHVQRFVVAVRGGRVAACAELAPLSREIAEIRSLVVDADARRERLGSRIVDELIARAKAGGFAKLCAFTSAPAYFVRHGFSLVPHVWLPEKIVTDCHACPRFRLCGQYAMMRDLRGVTQTRVPQVTLHG